MNYITTGSELTSIANAIREKGGTTEPLTYPSEFVSAIEAIPTGGEQPTLFAPILTSSNNEEAWANDTRNGGFTVTISADVDGTLVTSPLTITADMNGKTLRIVASATNFNPGVTSKVLTYVAPAQFETDTWDTIKNNVINGRGSAYTVGSTKTITFTNGNQYVVRVANNDGNLYEYTNGENYTGFVVEFVDVIQQSAWASNGSNTTPLGDTNPLGTITLPSIEALLPNDMINAISTVKVVSAQSGDSGTLVSSDMKLFIPAVKEISTSNIGARTEEFNALTTWDYYANGGDKIKKYNGSNKVWWTRSPNSGSTSAVMGVYTNGVITDLPVTAYTNGVSPCFCI